MVTKSKPAAQTDFFSATTEFTVLPTKKYGYRKLDPMDAARASLIEGINKQLALVSGKDVKGRKWYQSTHNGIYGQIRLSNKAMLLNGNSDAFHARSTTEASRLYSLALDAIISWTV